MWFIETILKVKGSYRMYVVILGTHYPQKLYRRCDRKRENFSRERKEGEGERAGG